MKSVKFLLAIFSAAVLMASCATTQDASGDDYDDLDNTRRIGNRVYVNDPFYGTVVLERDPYTGRYYDVTNGGVGYRGVYRSPYNTYRGGYRGGGGYYNNRVYRNNNVRGNVGSTIQQRPSQPQQQEVQKTREEARKKILGN